MPTKKIEDLEYDVFRMIKDRGEKGILQSQLWRRIKATSREGSRISLRLERAGLIERHRELHNGKWTYRLIAKKRPVNPTSILELPCAFCLTQDKCGLGSQVSPSTCPLLTQWAEKISHQIEKGKSK
jgi:hypothetical protein